MKWKLIITAAFFVLVFSSCTNNQQEENTATANEQQNTTDNNMASAAVVLPSFSVKDVNGNVINLQSLKGKKLFVNLWASWCPPCKREMPSIEKLSRSVDSNKVQFVLISLDDQFELAKKYISSKGYKLPVYYPVESPPALFNVQGIPATFIFNENGELIKRIDGSDNYDTGEYKTLLQ
jgi:thiol-disulfide isomerase/thioredoxin